MVKARPTGTMEATQAMEATLAMEALPMGTMGLMADLRAMDPTMDPMETMEAHPIAQTQAMVKARPMAQAQTMTKAHPMAPPVPKTLMDPTTDLEQITA